MPGALALGDLKATTSVRLGRGGALAIDNSGTGSVAQITVAGTLNVAGLSAGTGPMTCGALSTSSASVGSGGQVRCDVGSAPAPALCFGVDRTTGLYRSAAAAVSFASGGTESLRVGSTVSALVPLTTNSNTFACDALTCGALSCASIASAGDITQTRYSLRLFKNASLPVANSTISPVTWDAVETSGGGAVNWPFTPGSVFITCPAAGRYLVAYQIMFATGAATIRDTWVEINSPGGTLGLVRRYAERSLGSTGTDPYMCGGCFTYQFSAGDTIGVAVFQGTGGTLNMGSSGNQTCEFGAVRLSE
ncbi:MAG TPA: hypothetical protein VNI01_05180 [Elusimicrobiota bacterium]|nr:hypothetical protein [Elusimicrobiota bacterium]